MSGNVERFIDLLGRIDDRYIRIAAPETVTDIALMTEMHRIDISKLPRSAPEKKISGKLKALIISASSLAAAAVLITGAVLLWKNLDISIDPSHGNTEKQVEILEDPDIRNLKWGMTLEEVRAHETAQKVGEEIHERDGKVQFLLNYEDVEFRGYSANMSLSVMRDSGLDGVNYRIPTLTADEADSLYNKFAEELKDLPHYIDDIDGMIFRDISEEGYTIMLQNGVEYVQYSYFPLIDWEDDGNDYGVDDNAEYETAEVFSYSGNGVLTENSFDVFEKYFYGKWRSGSGLNDCTMNYSDDEGFDFGNDKLTDIYLDNSYAYMYVYNTVVMETGEQYGPALYLINIETPDTMYRIGLNDYYTDAQLGGCGETYTKSDETVTEDDMLGFFGIYRTMYLGDTAIGDPIDESLDCERILLDRANKLQELVSGFLNDDMSKLIFNTEPISNEEYRVTSDFLKTDSDYRNIFSYTLSDHYFNYINYRTPNLHEEDGELHYYNYPLLNTITSAQESWYIGSDVTDTSIIGHFAVIHSTNEGMLERSDYLNNILNYEFYDIIVKNIGGNYVITGVTDRDYAGGTAYITHGLFYRSGVVDKSLITNEAVKPSELNLGYETADKSAFALLGNEIYDDENSIHISDENWTVSDDYELFRKYFFGIWSSGNNRLLEISDAESQNFYYKFTNFFLDFYTVGENVLAFVTGGSAGSETYWIDINEPEVMYIAQGDVGDFPYGFPRDYHGNIMAGKTYKTDKPVPEPENGYCSVFRLREYADALGFDRGLLTDFYPDSKPFDRRHDDNYYFYPVYLIESDKGYLKFRTTVGNPYNPENDIEIVYAIDDTKGEWAREIISETPINQ